MKIKVFIVFFTFIIFGCSTGYPDLGEGYRIDGEGGYATEIVNSKNNVMISEYILDYSTDSTFILVAQAPPDSLPKMKLLYYSDDDRKQIANNKKVLRKFWIINKKENCVYSYDSINQKAKYSNVFGPYNRNQYYEERKKLGVPTNLKLSSE